MRDVTSGHTASLAMTAADIEAAAAIVSLSANRTPIVTSRQLDERLGGAVFFKCENFQRTGSFKFRGAFHAVSLLTAAERQAGVVTYSSGNHAQALALVGRLLDTRVTVVMPSNAPAPKRAAAAEYGAEIVEYDPVREVREQVAGLIQDQRGSTLIPPFDHPHVVAGQGTAALELIREVGDLDLLLVPCGGGGLLSGSALAASVLSACDVIGVEPELADDATRSFRSGIRQRVESPPTVADGLRTSSLGDVTWPLVRDLVSDMRTVTEGEIVSAMHFLWSRMKLVVEPSGAVALAALLADPLLASAKRVGVIVSGGNVDLETACGLLRGSAGIRRQVQGGTMTPEGAGIR